MIIHLIAVGKNMPSWVKVGYEDYAKRFPAHCRLQLHEIEASKRHKNQEAQAKDEEGKRILAAIPKQSLIIALEVTGKSWNTAELSSELQQWLMSGGDVSLLVGGPNGLSQECVSKAEQKWSLSPLTFPHPLVRIILAEQLYRAISLSQGHPYHRA